MAQRGVNRAIIIGSLGNDPETRFFPDGGAVTNASIATSESWKDRQSGEKKEKTEWHRVVFRDRGNYRLGQVAGEYLKKGSKVYVEGKLQTRKWQDESGNDRYTTEIVANEMQMLDSRGEQKPAQQTGQEPHQGQHYGRDGQEQAQPASSRQESGFDNFDDSDIPF